MERRDDLEKFLDARHIPYRRFWFPLHTQEPYHQTDERFPNTVRLWPKAIWFPSAFQLTDDDVRYVSQAIREFYRSAA